MSKKIKALSFFSGAMGLDIGLEKAGIEVILACESEKFIRETIKLNRPNLKVLEDINNYSIEFEINPRKHKWAISLESRMIQQGSEKR